MNLSLQSLISPKIMKAFQSVLHVLFILCYTMLQVFLSLIFALISVRNTRERIRENSLAINLVFSRVGVYFNNKI